MQLAFLMGRDADGVEALNDGMQVHIHYVGRGGIASFAWAGACTTTAAGPKSGGISNLYDVCPAPGSGCPRS